MNVKIHEVQGKRIAEMLSDGIVIRTSRDAMDIISELLSRGLKELILYEKNVAPEFLQLRTGIAGEVLQMLANNHMSVGFVEHPESHRSKSLQAFTLESSHGNQMCFAGSLESVLERMGSACRG